MAVFKFACSQGISRAKVAYDYEPPEGITEDKVVDLLSSLPVPLAGALTAPGGRWVESPLRQVGRSVLEGTGGGIAGSYLGKLIGMSGGPKGRAMGEIIGRVLGAAAGGIHGGYASRRNVREETGDYSPYGFRRDYDKQAPTREEKRRRYEERRDKKRDDKD